MKKVQHPSISLFKYYLKVSFIIDNIDLSFHLNGCSVLDEIWDIVEVKLYFYKQSSIEFDYFYFLFLYL